MRSIPGLLVPPPSAPSACLSGCSFGCCTIQSRLQGPGQQQGSSGRPQLPGLGANPCLHLQKDVSEGVHRRLRYLHILVLQAPHQRPAGCRQRRQTPHGGFLDQGSPQQLRSSSAPQIPGPAGASSRAEGCSLSQPLGVGGDGLLGPLMSLRDLMRPASAHASSLCPLASVRISSLCRLAALCVLPSRQGAATGISSLRQPAVAGRGCMRVLDSNQHRGGTWRPLSGSRPFR